MNDRPMSTEEIRKGLEKLQSECLHKFLAGYNYCAHCGKAYVSVLQDTIEQRDKEVAELRKVLIKVQWIDNGGLKMCPCCEGWKTDGHKPRCALAKNTKHAKPDDGGEG
ncbi:MAG: hypothetical protein COA78_06740 [Blastopirellula sp.]|nr:MAG: hypothetical protein COA78_06740 [Blastopirellula sp.]